MAEKPLGAEATILDHLWTNKSESLCSQRQDGGRCREVKKTQEALRGLGKFCESHNVVVSLAHR